MERPLVLFIVSSLKHKLLFAFRLLLLFIIITVLCTQLYGILSTTAGGGADPALGPTAETTPWGGIIEFFKDYYRGTR
ncbi:MAG: hypothetical protein QMC81_01780 [Thermoanaerobacterales bacterium]|nr:hypothetical protein [Bacillota bacterium]MDI6906204.1 hypothetical protein [Thermoanaerobacterales bacterium]